MRISGIVIVVVVAAAVAGVIRLGGSAGRTLVEHDFSSSAQGWQVATDTGLIEATFVPRTGNTGGYISGDDEAGGETWYFRAPDEVLAHLRAAGGLSYRLRVSSTEDGFPDDDVVIVGTAGRLSYRFDYAPDTDWTSYSVRFSAPGWRWNWNAPATPDQIRKVLADPMRLEIRGEYRTGHDVGGMDDFTLTADE